MKAHQRVIREKRSKIDRMPEDVDNDIKKAIVEPISYQDAKSIIDKYEWLGKMPQRTTHTFGIFYPSKDGTKRYLAGALVFSIPPTPQTSSGVCGEDYARIVKSMSRGACVWWAHEHSASKLIGESLKWMISNTEFRVFLAYADLRAGERGVVYRAANFKFAGYTTGDTEYLYEGNWYSGRSMRHKSYRRKGVDYKTLPKRKAPPKLRFVFIGGSKTERKYLNEALRYEILPFPSEEEIILKIG